MIDNFVTGDALEFTLWEVRGGRWQRPPKEKVDTSTDMDWEERCSSPVKAKKVPKESVPRIKRRVKGQNPDEVLHEVSMQQWDSGELDPAATVSFRPSTNSLLNASEEEVAMIGQRVLTTDILMEDGDLNFNASIRLLNVFDHSGDASVLVSVCASKLVKVKPKAQEEAARRNSMRSLSDMSITRRCSSSNSLDSNSAPQRINSLKPLEHFEDIVLAEVEEVERMRSTGHCAEEEYTSESSGQGLLRQQAGVVKTLMKLDRQARIWWTSSGKELKKR